MSVLEVKGLSVEFRVDSGTVRAVNDISFSVEPGRTLAVVGESGSGKTATALSILRLNPQPPAVYTGGEIHFGGRDLLTLPEHELRSVRGKGIAMIFQDPMTSLNPVRTVGAQIVEAVRRHEPVSRHDAKQRAVAALREVGIANPEDRAGQYPHQFSGGMRQRVMIAIALACRPKVLIADEPTTALDVTVQAQVMELLADLKQRMDMAVVLITHDLGVVAEAADDVLVMYAGRAVERAPAADLFARPMMPYTVALLRSVPRVDRPRGAIADPIPGSPPNLLVPPSGCPFQPRCFLAQEECEHVLPELTGRGPGRSAACVLPAERVLRESRQPAVAGKEDGR
ncbi:MAG TPA: ABC transporter ATP-binding protein [Pseudonocardiaceae bacterium]|jgi:oligopeptide/dipeptide ABC transporter ATP-binding protein|nr:ABC transporter ATP-binding protein [Pseudonocardiaceae bacterium]